MKLFIVNYGFYSDHTSVSEFDSIWTTYEKAEIYVEGMAKRFGLEYKKGAYTNGDHWYIISEIKPDTEYPFDFELDEPFGPKRSSGAV